jgi:hypothetical protein
VTGLRVGSELESMSIETIEVDEYNRSVGDGDRLLLDVGFELAGTGRSGRRDFGRSSEDICEEYVVAGSGVGHSSLRFRDGDRFLVDFGFGLGLGEIERSFWGSERRYLEEIRTYLATWLGAGRFSRDS